MRPPLARQLGEMIGESRNNGQTVFIATHSVELLKGILSKCPDANVIRITQPEPGIYFAHGQNKQTLPAIARMYQKIGVSYETITDFDALRVPPEFSDFLTLTSLDEKKKQKLMDYANKLRDIVNKSVEIDGLSAEDARNARKNKRGQVYHRQGICFFDEKLRSRIRDSLRLFGKNHVHIVETGELETLLEDCGVPYQEKSKWIIAAIARIANMPAEDIPQESYLYRFLEKVVKRGSRTQS